MSKRNRSRIFYFLCAVFVISGALAVFYAQGWRFDFQSFGFNKVGAIYLRSFPDDAAIFLNDKHIDKNPGIFSRGRFIDNLFPKNYKLVLTKDGYLDWQEHISVSSTLVSEVKYAVLVPKNSEIARGGTAKNFWVDDGQLITYSGKELLADNGKISGTDVILNNPDSKTVITKNSSTGAYFISYLSADKATSTSLNNVLNANNINPSNVKEIIRDSANSAIFRTNTSIFSINLPGREISAIASSSAAISKFAASPSLIAWTNPDKTSGDLLVFYSRGSRSAQNKIILQKKAVKLAFRGNDELGVLQNDGSFYMATPNGELQKMADDAVDFYFSPNSRLVAVLEKNALEIFAFNAEKDYWRFRLPDAGSIEKLEWYRDENHLFAVYPDKTRFLDLNDKNLENFSVIAEGANPHYDEQSNALYFISGNELKKIVFPN